MSDIHAHTDKRDRSRAAFEDTRMVTPSQIGELKPSNGSTSRLIIAVASAVAVSAAATGGVSYAGSDSKIDRITGNQQVMQLENVRRDEKAEAVMNRIDALLAALEVERAAREKQIEKEAARQKIVDRNIGKLCDLTPRARCVGTQ